MPTIISGALESDSVLSTNQMPDNDRYLYLLKPYQSMFFNKLMFSNRPAKEVTDSTGEFSWFEDELYPHLDTLSGSGISGGATSEDNIGLSNPTYWQVGDILLINDTEEEVYVDSIAGGQVDITSVDGSTITAAAAGGYVTKVTSRNLEINTPRTAVATQEVKVSNYLTIHSETVEMSSREQGAKHFTNGRSFDEQVEKRVEEVKQEFERFFMLSTKSGRDTTGASPWTYGKGFLGLVTTNRIGYTEVTEKSLNTFLRSVFDTGGSGQRDLYCGSVAAQDINYILTDKVRLIAQNLTQYKIDFQRYQTVFGQTNIYWNPRLDGGFNTKAFAVDWDGVTVRYMANDKKGSQKFRIEEDVETPGTSESKVKIYADVGFELANESTDGIYEPA